MLLPGSALLAATGAGHGGLALLCSQHRPAVCCLAAPHMIVRTSTAGFQCHKATSMRALDRQGQQAEAGRRPSLSATEGVTCRQGDGEEGARGQQGYKRYLESLKASPGGLRAVPGPAHEEAVLASCPPHSQGLPSPQQVRLA